MEILIGKQGNQPIQLTESTISRRHAILHFDEQTGRLTLTDNNSTNGTWVMGKDGKFKRLMQPAMVSDETLIRLGAEFTCRIKQLYKKPEPPKVNISNLRDMYDEYMANKMRLDAKASNIMMWRMASMTLGGLFGVVISMIIPKDFIDNQTVGVIVKAAGTVLAILISWLIVNGMNKNLIRQKDENERFFKENYRCPKCGYHFGLKIYNNILAEGKCPNNNCKCRYSDN